MKIRKSNQLDKKAINKIHLAAFGDDKGPVIAKLVMDLFDDETAFPLLSLVAEEGHDIVGHILFTKAQITQTDEQVSAQILAPLAVLPEAQNTGVGTQLINAGLKLLKEAGEELVFVLGHPDYYPRCGFAPAGVRGFEAPYSIPEEHSAAWMVQELNGNALGRINGRVKCSKVLNEPQHWEE